MRNGRTTGETINSGCQPSKLLKCLYSRDGGALGQPKGRQGPVHRLSVLPTLPVMHSETRLFSAILALASSVAGLNILLTNDDSRASANIRATFDALQKGGHNVLLVGSAVQRSGKGGTFVLPTSNIGEPGGEFETVKVVVYLVTALSDGVNTTKKRLLPLGIGITVNLPTFGPRSNCTNMRERASHQ
ncbi:hypothetical protein OBBRIDRAFT_788461 [Obba rivulosa]|uniref:Survival protein SurE-like phosphatase/nucleotidase domain-containing protein n=1 Tax=Obba rivulosa TaxID=1052685 RepID=A0A8E2DT83_9APHY|nr:hypothetical protein OBBRIDRAFT_788461 [Obba rivulosa]